MGLFKNKSSFSVKNFNLENYRKTEPNFPRKLFNRGVARITLAGRQIGLRSPLQLMATFLFRNQAHF